MRLLKSCHDCCYPMTLKWSITDGCPLYYHKFNRILLYVTILNVLISSSCSLSFLLLTVISLSFFETLENSWIAHLTDDHKTPHKTYWLYAIQKFFSCHSKQKVKEIILTRWASFGLIFWDPEQENFPFYVSEIKLN